MMHYQLRSKSHNRLTIWGRANQFNLIPNRFKYEKWFPERDNSYRKVVSIEFRWLFWNYELLIRQPK